MHNNNVNSFNDTLNIRRKWHLTSTSDNMVVTSIQCEHVESDSPYVMSMYDEALSHLKQCYMAEDKESSVFITAYKYYTEIYQTKYAMWSIHICVRFTRYTRLSVDYVL